jgi:hypothetical protein
MGDAPVLLVPCLKKRDMPPRDALPEAVAAQYEAHLTHQEKIRGSSIYPAIQNIILACRALRLGTLITTNHILYEDEVRAILGLPDDVFAFALGSSSHLCFHMYRYSVSSISRRSARPSVSSAPSYASREWPFLFGGGSISAGIGAKLSQSSRSMRLSHQVRTATFGIRCTPKGSLRALVRR